MNSYRRKSKILIDNREKLPLSFQDSRLDFLSFGDYSIEGFKDKVQIERKSLNDFVASTTGENRNKFESKIVRAVDSLDYYALVLECSLSDLDNKNNWYGDTLPSTVKGTAIKWSVKHNIPVFFCEDHVKTAEVVESLLRGFEYYHKEEIKNV